MIQSRPILFILGIFLGILALAMAIPALMDMAYGDPDWVYFGESAAITGFVSVLLLLSFYSPKTPAFETRDIFILTTSSWFVLSFFASIPFILSSAAPTFVDAMFEAVSGLTTTGATVFKDLQYAPPGILLWRSLLQWLGGIGIVVMGLTILPALKIGGMQLFRSEFSDQSEKYLPRVSQIASAILSTYLLISMLCYIAYSLVGMPMFDAICLTMTTVSTGGFAPSDLSIGDYNSVGIESVTLFFMVLESLTLILLTRFFLGDVKALWRDSQTRVYISILISAALIMSLWLWLNQEYAFFTSLRYGTFTVVSLISTTGFSVVDYGNWTGFASIFLFYLFFIGGCTGSTSGGIKVFRHQILFKAAKAQFYQLRRPHGVFVPSYNNLTLKEKDFMSILAFVALYILSYAVLSACLSLSGLDFLSSLSGAASCIGNVGPALGDLIGPSGTFSPLPETSKWIMMFGMVLGRLELLTLLILFTPGFWRT